MEKTVSYGTGTGRGPQAILDASLKIETFDEETLVEFAEAPRMHTLAAAIGRGPIEECLARIRDYVRPLRDKFLLALGGEHTVTYGLVTGLVDDRAEEKTGTGSEPKAGDVAKMRSDEVPVAVFVAEKTEVPVPLFSEALAGVTVVQIDAHADLADELDGRRWSHGTVMRRLWERGCRLVQIGIRSLTRDEYSLATAGSRITTYYAHDLEDQWADVLAASRGLEGKVYLTIDVDGLDPSIIPSTGTPQPNGLSWRQTIDVIRTLSTESHCQLVGADIVEFVPSPVPPGCDPTAARLAAKVLAWWWKGRTCSSRSA